jgi:hypothetical protein
MTLLPGAHPTYSDKDYLHPNSTSIVYWYIVSLLQSHKEYIFSTIIYVNN